MSAFLTLNSRERQELDVYLTAPSEWKRADKDKLIKAVREDALRERMRTLVEDREKLVEAGKSRGATEAEKRSILERLRELKERSDEVKAAPDEELFHNREEDFDWMRISTQTVRLWIEIELMRRWHIVVLRVAQLIERLAKILILIQINKKNSSN